MRGPGILQSRILAASIIALTACAAPQPAESPVLSPAALNASPSGYDGRLIAVAGYLILKPEAHVMYESKAAHETFRENVRRGTEFDAVGFSQYCLTLLNVQFLEEHRETFDGQTVTLKGRFKSSYLDGTIVDLGACPMPTALVLDDGSIQDVYAELTSRAPLPASRLEWQR